MGFASQPRNLGMSDFIKRFIDIILSFVGIMLLLPVFAIVSLLVLFLLGQPILFTQTRPGRGGEPFLMYKFRTMLDVVDASGAPLPDDQRLTRFGKLLRSTSLDELPELFNVLVGDMSLVGPRPLLMEYLGRYSAEQARRHEVRPGLTGWAQVNGRNALDWESRFKLDVWYVDNRTILLDLKILFLTLVKVVQRDGISASGESTMSKFLGSRRE